MSRIDAQDAVRFAEVAALFAGFGYAAVTDWRRREVSDVVWVALGIAGLVLGSVAIGLDRAPSGITVAFPAVVLWFVVSAFVLEHLLPWDEALARRHPGLPGWIEVALYLGVGAAVVLPGFVYGFGSAGVPPAVLAVYVAVVLARVLFELGLLYGGADAKALMVAGLVLPLDPSPIFSVPPNAASLLAFYPFPITLLMDAAVFAAVVPLGLAIRNMIHGEFEFPRGFIGYRIDVRDLPHRFVWVKDPTFRRGEDDGVESAEDDQAMRTRQAEELLRSGVTRVWVTPQLPFVVALAAGAVAGVLFGNLVFDLAAVL